MPYIYLIIFGKQRFRSELLNIFLFHNHYANFGEERLLTSQYTFRVTVFTAVPIHYKHRTVYNFSRNFY